MGAGFAVLHAVSIWFGPEHPPGQCWHVAYRSLNGRDISSWAFRMVAGRAGLVRVPFSPRSFFASYGMAIPLESSFSHLLHNRGNTHPLSDVFVCHMVPSGQTETPSQHSHFHCVKGLLVLGYCRPTLRSVKGNETINNNNNTVTLKSRQ